MSIGTNIRKLREERGFKQEQLAETCACCGKPARHMIYWGIAY